MTWLGEFNWTIRNIESTTSITNQSEKDKVIEKFEKLFITNRKINDTEIKKQLQPGLPAIKQKARQIHTTSFTKIFRKRNKQTSSIWTVRKSTKCRRGLFVSPVLIALKKDKSLKSALKLINFNESFRTRRPHIPNIE